MKRLRQILYAISAVGVAFMSCAEDDVLKSDADRRFPISVQANVVQQYLTRVSETGFADGDQIGVFIVNYDNGQPQQLQNEGNHADNVRYTYQAEKQQWNADPAVYWKDKETPVDAYSYYPYDAKIGSVNAYPFTIKTAQNETAAYEQSDFLWAKAENVLPTKEPINLAHRHIMAGVEVTVVEGEDFEEGEWEQLDKKVLVESTILNTAVSLSSGEVTCSKESASTSIVPLQAGSAWRAVVAPQTVAGGHPLLAIQVGGDSYHFSRQEPMTYYAGKLHKFTIKVDKKPQGDYVYTLISEAITPWEVDPVSHLGGSSEYYVIVNIKDGEELEDVMAAMQLDPEKIFNLKLVGVLTADNDNMDYLRSNFPNLEALNLADLRLKGESLLVDLGDYGITGREPFQYSDDLIPRSAFYGMSSLRYVVFPQRLKAIGAHAFANTHLSMSCILPEGLEYIGDCAFYDSGYHPGQELVRPHMTGDLYIPSSCRFIGNEAFRGQDFTCELILPEQMDYLGRDAFADCKYMTGYLHVPNGLQIVNRAWNGMTKLTGFAEIPEGAKTVEGIGCPISSLHIPEGVVRLYQVFATMPNQGYGPDEPSPYEEYRKQLKEVFLPSTLRYLGSWHEPGTFEGSGIRHIQLPDGIETIPEHCFDWYEDLQDTVKIPQACINIGREAFRHCEKLEAVVLPENLTVIDDGAFMCCYSLNYIRCLAKEPPILKDGWWGDPFYGVNKNNFTLVVPEDAVDTYRNAPGWSEFKRISAYRDFVCRPMQDKLLNKGHNLEIVLNADGNWTVTHQPGWAHISATSGYKKTALTVTVDDLSRGAGMRQDSIVFALTGQTDEAGKPVTCYYKLSQYDYEYEEDSELALQRATRGNGKINIFLCGDGYDAQDMAEGKYLSDLRQQTEYFFDVEPYKTYKDYFNVFVGFAMSRESGINSTNRWRETKFDAKLTGICHEPLQTDFDKALLYALEVSPQIKPDGVAAPLVIMALNTDQYAGVTAMWGDGAAVAACPMSMERYPYDARGIVQHEAGGHGFGKLADEYIYHSSYIQTCNCGCCKHVEALLNMKAMGWGRNLSLDGKYSTNEWRQLIFDARYGDICDIYEGGFFHQRGVFRSEVNSCMNNNVPYFSTVSRMAIVERIKQYAGETFSYDDFVANDSREWGNRFVTRGETATPSVGHGMHPSAPVMKKGSVLDLLKKNHKK
jgi:hypothetical protein